VGHRADGAVPQRTRVIRAAALLGAACLSGTAFTGALAAALPALTVYAAHSTVRTSLHLQPGFALIVRADRRIDTVAVGDPRMVAASPVHRGADVFDVVLQPLADTGTTNMVLWLGDITTVWSLDIGPGPRTADVVFVVTHPGGGPPAAGPAHGPQPAARVAAAAPTVPPKTGAVPHPAPAASGAAANGTGAGPGGGGAANGTADTAPAGPPGLELRQTVGGVAAVFHALRTHGGIVLRYEITNGTGADLLMKPATVLVRVDGRPVAYGMARDSVDRNRPDLIPRGATESGLIDLAAPTARRVELVLSLLPAAATPGPAASGSPAAEPPAAQAGTAPAVPVPIVLQATFSGLDRLPLSGP
jgi:hypothetical protein